MGLFDSNERKTYRDDNGYLRFKDSNILVHRWVAGKKIGRRLRREEVVHHINMDKMDNDASNLHVFRNQQEHERIHGINNFPPININSEEFIEFLGVILKLCMIIIEIIMMLIWDITKFICKYLLKLIKYLYYHFIHDFIYTQSEKILKNNP